MNKIFKGLLLVTLMLGSAGLMTGELQAAVSKLSQIASGGAINPATDQVVAVRSGATDQLVDVSSFLTAPVSLAEIGDGSGNISQWTNNSGYITSAPSPGGSQYDIQVNDGAGGFHAGAAAISNYTDLFSSFGTVVQVTGTGGPTSGSGIELHGGGVGVFLGVDRDAGLFIPLRVDGSRFDIYNNNSPLGPTNFLYTTDAGTVTPGTFGTGFSFDSGTGIVTATGGSNSWLLLGNAGTDPTVNFLGTTDAQDLVIKTNSIENMRISAATGYVGINTIADRNFLQVAGAIQSTGVANSPTGNGVTLSSETDFDALQSWNGRPLILNNAGDNVGIGAVSNPAQLLTVAGNFGLTDLTYTTAFQIGAQTGNIAYTLPTADAFGFMTSDGAGDLTWSDAPTDNSIYGRRNGTWTDVATKFWGLTGNAGTDPSINFLGTTDNQDLVLKANGIGSLRIQAADNFVGIGDVSSSGIADALFTVTAPAPIGSGLYTYIDLRYDSGGTADYKIGRNADDGAMEYYGTQANYPAYRWGGVDGDLVKFWPISTGGKVTLYGYTNSGAGYAYLSTNTAGDIVGNSDITTLPYIPTNAGDWAGSPTTVQEALDRMAAQVAILGSAPIP